MCEDILDSGIGEVLVREKAWAHFDQNGPDIHTCSQWVPHKTYKGVGESRLPQAFWEGISNAESLVTGERRKQPNAPEIGQGQGQSLGGLQQDQEARWQGWLIRILCPSGRKWQVE